MVYLNNKHSLILGRFMFLVAVWLLAACTSQEDVVTIEATRPSPTPTLNPTFTPTALPVTTLLPTPIPTATALPTLTTTPTPTPFATVTPPPTIATKTVFLQYGIIGGDGGSDTDLYYGRSMPSLVIYTDGQVILREGDWGERYFLETTISSNEMCKLLSQLQDFGFYEIYPSIYAFDETTEYSDGAGDGMIHVNGPLPRRLDFYGPYQDYLVLPLKQSTEFISNYRPSMSTYYIPERLILRIEIISESLSDNEGVALWPDSLPHITELWRDPINGELLIEGELVAPIMALFDYRMTGKAFSDEGVVYGMILRPLLPNESPYPHLGYYYDYALRSFNLPFACPALDLPAIDPTQTPFPLPAREPVAELAGKGRILFDSRRNGNSEIYVMNADGTNVLNLTNHLAQDRMAVWSPDGQKIAFVSDRDGNDELYLMNADGTNVTRLTYSPAREIAPKWSPDGKQIVFMSNRLTTSYIDNWQLFVIDVQTGVDYQFAATIFDEGMYGPDWFPNGEWILFSSGEMDALQIFMIEKNGERKTLLGTGAGAVLAPDGQRIAFLKIGNWGADQIVVMNVDGTDVREITDYGTYIRDLGWSPDGSYLLFTARHPSGGRAIFTISLTNEAQPMQLTSKSDDYNSPDWFP